MLDKIYKPYIIYYMETKQKVKTKPVQLDEETRQNLELLLIRLSVELGRKVTLQEANSRAIEEALQRREKPRTS